MIKIDVIGTEQVIAYLDQASKSQIAGAKRAMETLASRLYEEIISLLSGGMLQQQTGKLAGAQKVTVTDTGNSIILEAGFDESDAPYGKILIEGVPHSWEIGARSVKALRFEIGDEAVFAKRVVHPPAPPKSFLATALANIYPEVASTIRQELDSGL